MLKFQYLDGGRRCHDFLPQRLFYRKGDPYMQSHPQPETILLSICDRLELLELSIAFLRLYGVFCWASLGFPYCVPILFLYLL